MLDVTTLWNSFLNLLVANKSLADWLTAFGTVGAVVVALKLFQGKPKLRITLQSLPGEKVAYWHSRGGSGSQSYRFKQLRLWVWNDGRKEAKNCRVKLRIIQPHLKGMDSPVEFSLPATQLYKPEEVQFTEPSWMLSAPKADELYITISPHSKEAFDLLQNFFASQACSPYTLTSFPLYQNFDYILQLTAYAEDQKPTKPVAFKFKWEGGLSNLSSAVSLAAVSANQGP
jgi:hypothetical protein